MHSILLQVFRANWYIDNEYAVGAGIFLQQLVRGQLQIEKATDKPLPIIQSSDFSGSNSSKQPKQVAIINIEGVLMKHDQWCGPAGMDSIGEWIRELDNDPSISAIILKENTPGGTVEGTHNLGKAIADCKKPILSFIDENACSGGYWLASQTDEIWASSPRARVGSIGVMLSFADIQPMWEKEGVKFHEIYSDLSPEKNKDFQELRKGNYENYKKDVLNPLAEDFRSVVTSKRNITDKPVLQGKVVFAQDAIEIGLVDKIGSLQQVIDRAIELAEEHEDNINSQANTKMPDENISITNSLTPNSIDMSKFKRVAVVAGVETFETQDGFVSLSEEQMELLEAMLEQAETERAQSETLRTNSQNHESELQDRDGQISQRDTRITELENEVANLRRAPGDETAAVRSSSDSDSRSETDPSIAFYQENEDNPIACMEKLAEDSPNLKLSNF